MKNKKKLIPDTARWRLIDYAAANVASLIQTGDLPADVALLSSVDLMPFVIAAGQTVGSQDLEVAVYYERLTEHAEHNLIKDLKWRSLQFSRLPALKAGETVFKLNAMSSALGWLRIERIEGGILFCRDLRGELLQLPRCQVERKYQVGDRVYLYKRGVSGTIVRIHEDGIWFTAAGCPDDAPCGAAYHEIEPCAADGITGDKYPVSLLRPFWHNPRGWLLGHELPVNELWLEGEYIPLNKEHKAILSRLRAGSATRAMLSVAAFNHYQMLGGTHAIDRWRKPELRQLIAGGLVCEEENILQTRHIYSLTPSGRAVADTLPDVPNPLRLYNALVTIYSGVAGSRIFIARGKNPLTDKWTFERMYDDKRITASSRKRLMTLLWRYNWLYERREDNEVYDLTKVDSYYLEP